MDRHLRLPLLIVAGLQLTLPVTQAANIVVNGGFETNGGAGTSSFAGWSVVNQANGSGSWYAQTGTLSPLTSNAVQAPPEGAFAAMTDQQSPGSHALIQSFTVPVGGPITLSFSLYINNATNHPGPFVSPNSLDYTVTPNQQVRVDLLTNAAGAFDLGSAVLFNPFHTNSGDALVQPYKTYSFDISPFVTAGVT